MSGKFFLVLRGPNSVAKFHTIRKEESHIVVALNAAFRGATADSSQVDGEGGWRGPVKAGSMSSSHTLLPALSSFPQAGKARSHSLPLSASPLLFLS